MNVTIERSKSKKSLPATVREVSLHPYVLSSRNGINQTDSRGRVVILFNVSNEKSSVGTIRVRVHLLDDDRKSSSQPDKTFTIEPFQQQQQAAPSSSFVWIVDKKQLNFTSGSYFRSRIISSKDISSKNFFLLVMSKGAIIAKYRLMKPEIELKLTVRMVPSVRILLLAFTPGGHYVADSLRLDVLQGDCPITIRLSPNRPQVKVYPGSVVNFTIKGGQAGDVIGLHAIDEAVHLLRNTRGSSLSTYLERLRQSESGCGAGGGANVTDLIQSAGFKLLTASASSSFTFSHSKSCDRFKNFLRRRKRSLSAVQMVKVKSQREAFLDECCELGRRDMKVHRTCVFRREVTLNETNQECAERAFKCCNDKNSPSNTGHSPPTSGAEETTNKATSDGQNKGDAHDDDDDDQADGDPHLIRRDFRDTWLFDLILLNQSSTSMKMYFQTPHSITTWLVSTMSITSTDGFCLSSSSKQVLKVVTYKPFFMQVGLPRRMVEREKAEVAITIFNYEMSEHNVSLTFHRVNGICTEAGRNNVNKIITINGRSTAFVTIPIVPLRIGKFNITIDMVSPENKVFDSVLKWLEVRPMGIERIDIERFDIDPSNRVNRSLNKTDTFFFDHIFEGERTQITHLNLTARVGRIKSDRLVARTVRHTITVFGNHLSTSIMTYKRFATRFNAQKAPGQLNAYYISYTLFKLIYLDQIGRLTGSQREQGIAYLMQALAHQLIYLDQIAFQRIAFFAFDQRLQQHSQKRYASIWLTALATKVFCQASSSGFVTPQTIYAPVIVKALNWLYERQTKDGSWEELNPFPFKTSNATELTAFVTIAFHECHHYFAMSKYILSDSENNRFGNAIWSARRFLRGSNNTFLREIDKLHTPAVVAYALNHYEKNESCFQQGFLLPVLLSTTMLNKQKNQRHWSNNSRPIDIGAYTVLAIMKAISSNAVCKDETTSKDTLKKMMMSIVNWLVSHEGHGVFDGAADPTVAFEAIAKFYSTDQLSREDNISVLDINVWQRLHNTTSIINVLRIEPQNANVLHTIAVNRFTREIEFISRGKGFGKLNLLTLYNEIDPDATCKFRFEVALVDVEDDIDSEEFDFKKLEKVATRLKLKEAPAQEKYKFQNLTLGCANWCVSKNYSPGKRRFDLVVDTGESVAKRSQSSSSSLIVSASNTATVVKKRRSIRFLPPLPPLGENPIVMMLNLCVGQAEKRIPSHDIIIVEINMLSGYRPISLDLEALWHNQLGMWWFKENGHVCWICVCFTLLIAVCFRIH